MLLSRQIETEDIRRARISGIVEERMVRSTDGIQWFVKRVGEEKWERGYGLYLWGGSWKRVG